jgi:hypothetical protein
MANATSRLLYPRRREPVPIVKEAGWAPGPVWTGTENLTSTEVLLPTLPAHNELLYRLSYTGPHMLEVVTFRHYRHKTVIMQCTMHILLRHERHVWWEWYMFDERGLVLCLFNLKSFVQLDTWFTYLIWTVLSVVYSVFFIVLWHCYYSVLPFSSVYCTVHRSCIVLCLLWCTCCYPNWGFSMLFPQL